MILLKKVIWNPMALEWFKWGEEQTLDGLVRRTSYQEVFALLDTCGCSRHEPYWTSMVMGVIETDNGNLVVWPNSVILFTDLGVFIEQPKGNNGVSEGN
ncbi:hypothetical protein [Delftia phage PhiW-14]|uniref:Uncharacterized protein n=1 Tax=Delftia phage PhiW-14 TaxID=665032 RepID=C9DG74_BPW14|nr:hypothetical protein DP-phiW-14_gp104 [Delftia phage PhiW-14]ACV50125.1 hypothetical protein [Delftia phage PhiW-14]